eukprot:TRINITY_DN6417_c0_g1_i1.p1 TRINITY_DN6417_c0_g1~~TRINITY_DN6417_c0_g1_i1.p1  ORF type:complete len:52 (-),score=1.97 TRINITY_DN6417_c0_g1_i1:845-1000(-)
MLRSILETSESRNTFISFLQKEFCSENLQFYFAVESYRDVYEERYENEKMN